MFDRRDIICSCIVQQYTILHDLSRQPKGLRSNSVAYYLLTMSVNGSHFSPRVLDRDMCFPKPFLFVNVIYEYNELLHQLIRLPNPADY